MITQPKPTQTTEATTVSAIAEISPADFNESSTPVTALVGEVVMDEEGYSLLNDFQIDLTVDPAGDVQAQLQAQVEDRYSGFYSLWAWWFPGEPADDEF
jgi:hypothetical protein